MSEFKGKLNEDGLSSFNESLFKNMAFFADFVWVIDVEKEEVEILRDVIAPETEKKTYGLAEIRDELRARYQGGNASVIARYSREFLSELKSDIHFDNPIFTRGDKRYKVRCAMTPELDENGETKRVYLSGINTLDFLLARKENAQIYKSVSTILTHSPSIGQGLDDALNFVGHAFGVSRVYIFETDEKNPDLCHNTFEWCAPGIKPQKTKLQNVSYQRYGYDKFFGASELFCCEDRNLANPEMKEELASQNIVAMVNYAFYDKGRLAGFVGYDDCEKVRPDWSREKEDVEILVFVAELLAMYLIKERNRLRAVESKANETFLRAKEEENRILLRHFVEAYTSAYMVNLAERSFEIIHMSHEFQQVFTMNGGMADMARFVDNHVHPDDREMMRKMTDPDYVRARMKEEREISFTMREIYDDEERTMHVIIIRSVDCDHVAIGFMDVTAELKKEKEINEKLEIAAKARRGFLSSMSHDIRTPMNAILGMVDIALNHPDDKAKMIDSLQKIRTSGNHLLLLVNDVLDISAIESGKTELRPVVHAVKEKARFIQNTIQGILNGKDIAFHFDQHDILYPWIVVDETRLNQIINNLLSNAVKYTPEGGSVRFENYHERDEEGKPWNVIAISDTGIGMSEEFMAKMWEAFSRATDTRINEIQGAGLGLSIVKSLVDMMGGTITVESRLNVGSTFTVRLPIVPASPEALPAEAQAEESEKEGEVSAHVLVAEDNDLNWEVASELLAMHGITCVRAENGKLALERFLSAKPREFDAIFMDMQMPVMDGLEATKRIRASLHPEAKTIPIFAMTANAFAEDVAQCKASGMNDHLSKPIEMHKVIAVLRAYLKK